MFALGARAHKLVRSTTAILDGPMGGKLASKLDDDDVIIDGADGFDGLQGNGEEMNNSKKDAVATISEVPSGLLYEVAKNLALSGVGRIILVDDDNDDAATPTDAGYFDGALDDLGAAYRR